MLLKYGNYSFNMNECTPLYRTEGIQGEDGIVHTLRTSMSVTGCLLAALGLAPQAAQADIIQQESRLKTALAVPDQDLEFLSDAGNRTGICLIGQSSFTGVRITRGPDFTGTMGAEYASIREFSFEAYCETLIGSPGGSRIIAWKEELSFTGGGRKLIARNAISGPPQVQMVYPRTVQECVQSGSATGLLDYPSPARVQMPAFLSESPDIRYISPDKVGSSKYRNFVVSWVYKYLSISDMNDRRPTRWPAQG